MRRRAFIIIALAAGCSSSDGGEQPVRADAGNDAPSYDAGTPDLRPPVPAGLARWQTGNDGDALVANLRPGLILGGGGQDVSAAFEWAANRNPGGDVLVLRASGSDGYNDYLFTEIGGFDSVETLLVDTRDFADSDYLRWSIDHAELIFIAGGDQSRYLAAWTDTELSRALARAWPRGAVIGGTSAGCAILGEWAFSAENGSVYSSEALEDPYNEYMTLARNFVSYPSTRGVVTDTHFDARDRMGRLLAFVARAGDMAEEPITGIGVGERTSVVIDDGGLATVMGQGAAYLVRGASSPTTLSAGQALNWQDVPYRKLEPGESLQLDALSPSNWPGRLSASSGELLPEDPY